MQDLAAGGLDIVTCSVPEARAMIDAGRARSLAIMAPERNPQFANVPTLKEELGIDYSVGAWRGIAGPKGLPQDVQTRLVMALRKAYDSKEYKDFMTSRGFGMKFADPQGFATFMAAGNEQMGTAMKAAGLAKQT
jgi:tripartite-type tricarboxylate transporter receptor subunit TctC